MKRILHARPSSRVAAELVRLAGENAVDLVVLGARGLGAGKRLLLGSVSEAVLRDASCAVLIATRPRP